MAAMQAAWPEDKDRIMVGDFNCTPPPIATSLPHFYDRSTGSGSTLNRAGEVVANLYDHVLVRDGQATAEMQCRCGFHRLTFHAFLPQKPDLRVGYRGDPAEITVADQGVIEFWYQTGSTGRWGTLVDLISVIRQVDDDGAIRNWRLKRLPAPNRVLLTIHGPMSDRAAVEGVCQCLNSLRN
ncbi:MAG TPA: hypothetical protein VJ801_11235 [Polyangia bacterium]|jgi:hypothetical protein|nr:hypothetical protein [Polyangia bacterium]